MSLTFFIRVSAGRGIFPTPLNYTFFFLLSIPNYSLKFNSWGCFPLKLQKLFCFSTRRATVSLVLEACRYCLHVDCWIVTSLLKHFFLHLIPTVLLCVFIWREWERERKRVLNPPLSLFLSCMSVIHSPFSLFCSFSLSEGVQRVLERSPSSLPAESSVAFRQWKGGAASLCWPRQGLRTYGPEYQCNWLVVRRATINWL